MTCVGNVRASLRLPRTLGFNLAVAAGLGRNFRPLDIRVIRQNRLGTAVSRIAAIQPNVLALTNINGPLRPLT